MNFVSNRRGFLAAGIAAGVSLQPFSSRSRAAGSTPAPGATPAADAAFDAIIRGYVDDANFSGVVLVARDGTPIFRRAYGRADQIRGIANTPETAFQIASVTKGFTALAIVQLSLAGKLALDDPLTKYFPKLPHPSAGEVAITLRNLLNHTSGIPEFTDLYDLNDPLVWPRTLNELVQKIEAQPLQFTPGTQYAYSNSGYIFLGLIIRQLSGLSYEGYLRRYILDPIAMTQTYLFNPPNPPPPAALGYEFENGDDVAISKFGRVDLAFSAGGLTSTADDLLRWDQALYGSVLAPQAAIQSMFVPYLEGYGLGWQMEPIAGHPAVDHDGKTVGFRSKLARFIDDRATIILLTNQFETDVDAMVSDLAGALFTN